MYSFQQLYTQATPPEIGHGSGICIPEDATLTIAALDKYGQAVNSRPQYGGQNHLSFDVDVRYTNGSFAPSGSNFETGVIGPKYVFSKEKNISAFAGNPQRAYRLTFKFREQSPASLSSGRYTIYHNEATISGFSGVLDGTAGPNRQTGRIDINLSMADIDYYDVSKFEIYSGDSPSFSAVTGTGAGGNMLKSISVFQQKTDYTLTINEGEQPIDGNYYHYKILPYDNFGSGFISTSPISGIMYNGEVAPQAINNLTGRSVVILQDGAYCIHTLHTGAISGSDYQILDVVANISGNIRTGNYYNDNLDSSVYQNDTYPFRTIKYTAQLTDASGYCSSREILITDNTLSNISGHSGLYVSEYGSSDTGNLTRILVSGEGTGVSDYSRGTGYIYLMAQLENPNGQYKLWRTIL